jgi:NitT/TauT family transport system ATP-binding protein
MMMTHTTHSSVSIRLDQVSKAFAGQPVLEDINLHIESNEIVCILGPSGCGKTTLLNLVAGLLQPDAGRVVCSGRVGYVFQEPRLLPWRTVRDNVAFGLKARGVGREERDAIAGAYLSRLGLSHVAASYPHQLSGGMRQRVSLGRALAIDPDLLLLDEPFKSLDVLLRIDLLKLLTDEWQLKPRPVLFVTHEVGEAALVGRRAIVMSSSPGRIAHVISIDIPLEERHVGAPAVQQMEAVLYDLLARSE